MKQQHWLEKLMEEYGIRSRYQIEKLGDLKQTTTSAIIVNNTNFKDISFSTVKKLVDVILKIHPDLERGEVMKNLSEKYYIK